MHPSNDDSVLYREDGALRHLTINVPHKRNALSGAVRQRVLDMLGGIREDRAARVLILSGAGDTFISGGDISEYKDNRRDAATADQHRVAMAGLLRALATLDIPVIAMIKGYCLGAGLLVAGSCDLRICADDAQFGMPAARLGIGPPLEYAQLIVKMVGLSSAAEVMLTARRYSAAEALALGMVHRVAPAASLEAFVRDYALSVADNAPLSMKASKIALDEIGKLSGAVDLARCRASVDACSNSEDARLASEAFMQKKKPVFRGI